jgi:hypothetical protein
MYHTYKNIYILFTSLQVCFDPKMAAYVVEYLLNRYMICWVSFKYLYK